MTSPIPDHFPDPTTLEIEEISSRFNDLAYRQRTAKDLTDEEIHYAVSLNHVLRSRASATPKRTSAAALEAAKSTELFD